MSENDLPSSSTLPAPDFSIPAFTPVGSPREVPVVVEGPSSIPAGRPRRSRAKPVVEVPAPPMSAKAAGKRRAVSPPPLDEIRIKRRSVRRAKTPPTPPRALTPPPGRSARSAKARVHPKAKSHFQPAPGTSTMFSNFEQEGVLSAPAPSSSYLSAQEVKTLLDHLPGNGVRLYFIYHLSFLTYFICFFI